MEAPKTLDVPNSLRKQQLGQQPAHSTPSGSLAPPLACSGLTGTHRLGVGKGSYSALHNPELPGHLMPKAKESTELCCIRLTQHRGKQAVPGCSFDSKILLWDCALIRQVQSLAKTPVVAFGDRRVLHALRQVQYNVCHQNGRANRKDISTS